MKNIKTIYKILTIASGINGPVTISGTNKAQIKIKKYYYLLLFLEL